MQRRQKRRPAVFDRLASWTRRGLAAWRTARLDDRGDSVVATVIIFAGTAAIALGLMAAIGQLIDVKIGSIRL
jgi:hypothetical protein